MRIKLTEFKVQNFRCIDNSGWIKIGDITALVGVNESGKTALLEALHMLNPGTGELDINYIREFPRNRLSSEYNESRIITEGKFLIPLGYLKKKDLIKQFNLLEQDLILNLTRKYDSRLYYTFEAKLNKKHIPVIKKLLEDTRKAITRKRVQEIDSKISTVDNEDSSEANDQEKNQIFTNDVKQTIIKEINEFLKGLQKEYDDTTVFINKEPRSEFAEFIGKYNNKLSEFYDLVKEELEPLLNHLENLITEMQGKSMTGQLFEKIEPDLPVFIYFEDYSILKGSIVLPNLIKAIKGDIQYEEFKIQETLFKHVGLKPEEIYELGQQKISLKDEQELVKYIQKHSLTPQTVSEKVFEDISPEKQEELKKRKILLDSASLKMTETLNKYLLEQRNYNVEYDADGQFFQILIYDDIRKSKINLEDRSKGFRWYFSFFLVFLVESEGMHKNAILLLDEPGIHLHLQAQFNLINFFQKLKETNQIIYTTHSPFLIDENYLEQVRSVYEDKNGLTHVTENNLLPDRQAIFPLQAALSYSTSQVIYQGLKQILVEGDSDYNYIKSIDLISSKLEKITLDKDIIIIPCKSASKIEMYARLFRDLENIPVVLLDSDEEGNKVKEVLLDSLFAEYKNNILQVGDFLNKMKNAEIEDLFGKKILAKTINENNITDSPINAGEIDDGPFVNSLMAYCNKNKIQFKDRVNWKYQISLKFKNKIYEMDKESITNEFSEETIRIFETLIQKINENAEKKNKD